MSPPKADFMAAIESMRQRSEELRSADPEAFDAQVAAIDAQKAESAARERWTSRSARLERSGVKLADGLRTRMLADEMDDTQALEVTRAWLADKRRKPWLALCGKTGCGKTAAAAYALAEHNNGMFLRSEDVVRTFAGLFGDSVERQERANNARFLVVDDVGSEADASRMHSALVELLDERTSSIWTPTLLTTNLSAAEFRERYQSERLASRFAQAVQWTALTSKEDLRRRKREAKP
jgi:DNA replication protein DnaC